MPVYRLGRCFVAASAMVASLALVGCGKPAPGASTTAASAAATVAPATAPPSSAAPATGDAADAKAFLEGLYAHYKSSKNNTFSPLDKDLKAVFDPDMVQLLAKDAKLLKGEVGAMDGDPLCDCQDFDSIAANITIQSATATTAKATADLKVFTETHHNSFDLVKVNGAWRVHDVQEIGQPSLRKMLEDEIAQLSKPGAKKGDPDEAP